MIWGIDGDWMVNIIPAGVPFYPTDHCGVLRIKTEKILPEYMMYALQAEGEYERFPETTELPHKGSDRWLFRRRKQRSRRI